MAARISLEMQNLFFSKFEERLVNSKLSRLSRLLDKSQRLQQTCKKLARTFRLPDFSNPA